MDISEESNDETAAQRFYSLKRISEGAFGDVKLGIDRHTGNKVALKYVRLSSHGIPRAIFREMEALKQLKHDRIVDLIDVYPQDINLVMVFEFMASDLQHEISRAKKFLSSDVIKFYCLMILEALDHCHYHNIIHRDIKPSNILISSSGVVKLADFGLARVVDIASDASLSHQVATRWYRAPELLFGARHYSFAVDLWSVGAVLAELLSLHPLFPGSNDLDQIYRVFQVTGTPVLSNWPEVSALPDFGKVCFPDMQPTDLQLLIPNATKDQLVFLGQLIQLNPSLRPSARQACTSAFLLDAPLTHPGVSDELARGERGGEEGCSRAASGGWKKKASGRNEVMQLLDSVLLPQYSDLAVNSSR